MPWFRVDDTLSSHPKARRAGLPAMGLWVVCGAYASQYLTEGHVPEWFVVSWPSGKKHAAALVDAGLWDVAEGGWVFHQWDERQFTKDQVEAERAATRERQQKWRDRRRNKTVSNGVSNGVTDGVTNGAQSLPIPTLPSKDLKEPAPRKRGTRLDPDWHPTPADVEWQRNEGIDDLLARRAFPKFVDYWTAKTSNATKLDWSATWRNWLRTEQERAPRRPNPHDELSSARSTR